MRTKTIPVEFRAKRGPLQSMFAWTIHRTKSSCSILHIAAVCALFLAVTLPTQPSFGQTGASGLPLPRFVSTRSQPVKVRVGPGTRYDETWVFKKAGLPVEIIQEYDVWRKIRYADNQEGWVHQNLLTSRRMGIIRPWEPASRAALYAKPENDAAIRASLESGFLLSIDTCNGGWCAVEAEGQDANGKNFSLSGHIVQFEIWGVYPGEEFD